VCSKAKITAELNANVTAKSDRASNPTERRVKNYDGVSKWFSVTRYDGACSNGKRRLRKAGDPAHGE